ncbi:MAG: nitroreductase family protein [Desulfobacterales bacterium]|nr:nitroreductase family protein [Desulfobacterales bacterium]
MALSNYEKLLQIAKKRRSIRRFKPDPIPPGDVEKIIEVARHAMSGANAQPWEFVVVEKPETLAKIFELYRLHRKQVDVFNNTLIPELRHPVTGSLDAGQRIFQDAPVIIVVCGDPRTLLMTSLAAEVIGYERVTYHLAFGNVTTMIHLAATTLGLGTQWVSTTPIWEGELKSLLGIPEWFTVPHLVPVGYADYTPPPSYRRQVSEICHLEGYDPEKFRTDAQILDYIIDVRKRAKAAYYIPRHRKNT